MPRDEGFEEWLERRDREREEMRDREAARDIETMAAARATEGAMAEFIWTTLDQRMEAMPTPAASRAPATTGQVLLLPRSSPNCQVRTHIALPVEYIYLADKGRDFGHWLIDNCSREFIVGVCSIIEHY